MAPADRTRVCELDTQSAHALADLTSIFDDLQTALRCCELLIDRLPHAAHEEHPPELESLWTTTLLCYSRCFTAGSAKMALTEQDVTATALHGDVLKWHKVLRRLRKHYTDPANNPRERFSVGAVRDDQGQVEAIAVTSTPPPALDDTTVRQTGALALELSKLVDKRIDEQQRQVLAEVNTMSKEDLDQLPVVELSPDASARHRAAEGPDGG